MRPEVKPPDQIDTFFAANVAAAQERSDMPDLLVAEGARTLFTPVEAFVTKERMPLRLGSAAMNVVHISQHGQVSEAFRRSNGSDLSQVYEPSLLRFARRHFGIGHVNNGGPWGFDQPALSDVRELIKGPFDRQSTAELGDAIQDACNTILDARLEQNPDALDVSEYANEVFFRMASKVIGVDEDLAPDFHGWMERFNASKSLAALNPQPGVRWRLSRLVKSAEAEIESGGQVPGLLGHLALRHTKGHELGGNRMTRSDVVSLLWSVIAAGTDTPGTAATAAVYFGLKLGVFRQFADAAAAERGLLDANRLYPPFPNPLMRVAKDCDLNGVEMRKGQWAKLHLPAANRDPAAFDHPDTYNPARADLARSTTFGSGPHYCIGAHYGGRVGAQILATLANRVPDLALQTNYPYQRRAGILHNFKSMPVNTNV